MEHPDDAVYVGRGTPWGNPFPRWEYGGRRACLERFLWWAMDDEQAPLRARAREELRGRHLLCSCWPLACHAWFWILCAASHDDDQLRAALARVDLTRRGP